MPKHVALGIAIRHLTRSKQLITMLSRMCHCDSYDEVDAMDTSLAKETPAKSDLFGVMLPSNICPDVFVQVAGVNNDNNEETLDGKTTTLPQHWSSISEDSLVQPQTEGLRRPNKEETVASIHGCMSIHQTVKRPPVTSFSGNIQVEWFKCTESLHSATCMMDLVWALIRMTPM